MIADWKENIAIAWLVKQAMMELDTENIFPYHMPELAASYEDISKTKKMLGHELDAKVQKFPALCQRLAGVLACGGFVWYGRLNRR